MKFQNEIRKMKKGDRFRSNESDIFIGEHGVPFWDREPSVPVHLIPENMDLEGEIIRAEPEVLTSDQLMDLISEKNDDELNNWDISYDVEGMHQFIDVCRQNFRLEEWRRLKPFIDAAYERSDGHSKTNKLSNLARPTPPWETE